MGTFSHGTTIGYNTTAAPTTYTVIAKVRSFPFPEIETEDLDASHLTSTDQYREWVSGWKDGGELDVELIFTEDEYATLLGIVGSSRGWQITLPVETGHTTAGVLTFNGHLKGLGGTVDHEDILMASATIKVSGPPEFTAGTDEA